MKVAISGASGMIGTALRKRLEAEGNEVIALERASGGFTEGSREKLLNADAVVNLAGENVAGGRWTPEQKKKILDSRVETTRALVDILNDKDCKVKALVSGSAIGIYGASKSDAMLDEGSPSGSGFLADVCRAWEAEADRAERPGLRVVKLRTGVVLGKEGGALSKMLLPFQMGAGGPLGDGRQYMSWISLDDAASAIAFILQNDSITGPVNMTAPNPVTNATFTAALGRVLSRPAFIPAPAFALNLILGEMAQEMLLEGQRVMPRKLEREGFKYVHGDLQEALKHEIQKS